MIAPKWLLRSVVEALHDAQLAEHGGASGLRDDSLLEAALARPRHLQAYGAPDLCALAAAVAFGIARNHPFVDGNKRTAFLAAYVFLRINGLRLTAEESDVVRRMTALAAGEMSEEEFAAWLRAGASSLTT